MTYNLTEERFLPVQYEDGKTEKRNLNEVLKDAHNIVSIKYKGTCHLSQFAMYRLLVVLAIDIMRPTSADDILDIYEYVFIYTAW